MWFGVALVVVLCAGGSKDLTGRSKDFAGGSKSVTRGSCSENRDLIDPLRTSWIPFEPHGSSSNLQSPQQPNEGGYRFRTGIELVNVTATVTDENGRFVRSLQKENFIVYEDGKPQTITYFSAERVPVSLGIVLDMSGSMDGEKMEAAQQALRRFLHNLPDPRDEIFLYEFSDEPRLLQGWTTDREKVRRAMSDLAPRGGTAMYDAVADAVRMAQSGHNLKKAVVVISDGDDNSSHISLAGLQELIRESEVLVYAIGIDAAAHREWWRRPSSGDDNRFLQLRQRFPGPQRPPIPWPFPVPGGKRRPPAPRPPTPETPQPGPEDQPVNEPALRQMTDDTGGRTEIIHRARDLDPATASIADELSRQYFFGYPRAARKDGLWHTIEVEVPGHSYHVRARRGYVAS